MPYPNYHAARVRSPDAFVRIVVLKTLSNGILIKGGPLKSDPDGDSQTQSYWLPRSTFTAAEARSWLKDHDVSYTEFEPATGAKECEFTYGVSFQEAEFVRPEDSRGPPTIRNVVLLGAESRNKRRYEHAAMRRAVELFENAQAFLNHPSPDEVRMGSRDVRLLAGGYRNVRFDESDMKVRADFVGLPGDPASAKYLAIAEHAPFLAGNSQNAQGKVRHDNGMEIVEEITKVLSVDLVTNPATTSGMFEHQNKQEEGLMDYAQVTLVGLKEQRSDLVQRLVNEGKGSRDEEVGKLTSEKDAAVKEADELKAKVALTEKQALVDKLLDESELPDEARTDTFRNLLLKVTGDNVAEQVKEMIDDRVKAIGTATGGVRHNTPRRTGNGATMTAQEAADELMAVED